MTEFPLFRCETFLRVAECHCTAPAVRVVYSTGDPTIRLLMCEGHPGALRGLGWASASPEDYEAAYGPLVQDEPITGGRIAPKDSSPV